jgi:hypothetical protein
MWIRLFPLVLKVCRRSGTSSFERVDTGRCNQYAGYTTNHLRDVMLRLMPARHLRLRVPNRSSFIRGKW